MSNALAIAAVTATLHKLIEDGIKPDNIPMPESIRTRSEIRCTTLPLDLANEENRDRNRVNLFLYKTHVNAALSNMNIPNPNDTGKPPLALKLYYLITAYGEDHDRYIDHLLLAQAMLAMHDLPFLPRDEIQQALAASGLHEQYELVHIAPQPLSVDDMSKLWATFQTQYRISAAYELSVVLIDSMLRRRAPLPVLRRGEADRGAFVLPGASPLVRAVHAPHNLPGAELGHTLRIEGERLDVADCKVRFRYLRDSQAVAELAPQSGGTATELRVKLPDENDDPNVLGQWPVGVYALSLTVVRQELPHPWQTSETHFVMVPQITIEQPPNGTAAAGTVDVKLACKPQLREAQYAHAFLYFGDRQITPLNVDTPANPYPPPENDPTQPTTLEFQIPDVAAGSYRLRLRVDGIDSLPFKWTEADGFTFDPAQTITVL